MNRIKKYYLLTQIKTTLAFSVALNFMLGFALIWGFNGFVLGLISTPIIRIIEELMGYSYYQEALRAEERR